MTDDEILAAAEKIKEHRARAEEGRDLLARDEIAICGWNGRWREPQSVVMATDTPAFRAALAEALGVTVEELQ